MKKITLCFLLISATVLGFSQQTTSGLKVNLFYEDFETFAIPGNMHGWNLLQTNLNQTWAVCAVCAHSGSQYIRINPDFAMGMQDEWLITGYINLTGTVHPTFSFWWSGDRYHSLPPNNNVNFTVHSRPDDGSGWTNIFNEEMDTNSWQQFTWKQEIIDLPPNCINAATVKIAFFLYGQNGGEFGFDDVVVEDNYLGTGSTMDNMSINIYPNPVSDVVYIHTAQKPGRVDLFNATGQIVLSKHIGGTDGSIDVSGLSEGIYILGATTPDGYMKSKISIVR